MQVKVLFARFTYGDKEHPDCVDWLIKTYHDAKTDPRISDIWMFKKADTPITMVRNDCLEHAKQLGIDYVCMVDSDQAPDCEVGRTGAKPFWKSTFDFMLEQPAPCVVGAPYCGPPPNCNIYVFRWGQMMNESADPVFSLDQYGREEAATMTGIGRVGALPTGLILIDMRAITKLSPPYFHYEWTDENLQHKKASTEDVVFSRNLALAGVPIYCNWDAWAGHWKPFLVTKPQVIYVDHVDKKYREAIQRDLRSDQRIVMFDMPSTGKRPTPNGQPYRSEETPGSRLQGAIGPAGLPQKRLRSQRKRKT